MWIGTTICGSGGFTILEFFCSSSSSASIAVLVKESTSISIVPPLDFLEETMIFDFNESDLESYFFIQSKGSFY